MRRLEAYLVVALVVAAMLGYACMNRYYLVTLDGQTAYRLDRWTGSVVFLTRGGGFEVKVQTN